VCWRIVLSRPCRLAHVARADLQRATARFTLKLSLVDLTQTSAALPHLPTHTFPTRPLFLYKCLLIPRQPPNLTVTPPLHAQLRSRTLLARINRLRLATARPRHISSHPRRPCGLYNRAADSLYRGKRQYRHHGRVNIEDDEQDLRIQGDATAHAGAGCRRKDEYVCTAYPSSLTAPSPEPVLTCNSNPLQAQA